MLKKYEKSSLIQVFTIFEHNKTEVFSQTDVAGIKKQETYKNIEI
jgi:hypothetical protein